MSTVAIVTSSAASLPKEIIERYNIHLVPFTIQFVDGNVRDINTVSMDEFYRRLTSDSVIPATSPPSAAQYMHVFQQITAETILVFHISSQISKSYENGQLAAQRLPDRQIINIDTKTATLATGLQVLATAEAIAQGQSVAEILKNLPTLIQRTSIAVTAPSIRFLRLSGRIGVLAAMAASFFGIVPVIKFNQDGVLNLHERARSIDDAIRSMLNLNRRAIGEHKVQALGIAHTNDLALAQRIQTILQRDYPDIPIYINDAGPVIAVHVGPGVVAIAALRAD